MLAATLQSQYQLHSAETQARDIMRFQHEQALTGLITHPEWDFAISECDYESHFGTVNVKVQVDFDGVAVLITDEFGQEAYTESRSEAINLLISVML